MAVKEWKNKIKNERNKENSKKYINCINNHFKCQWSKYTH